MRAWKRALQTFALAVLIDQDLIAVRIDHHDVRRPLR
jgi:hypothetical protein